MKTLIIAAAFLALGSLARCADAAEPKPVVCLSYEVVRPDLAVCSDTKRPFIMRSFSEVRSARPDGAIVSVLVGWR